MIRTLAAVLATSTCIVALATPAAAQTREYNIPAGSLKSALDDYVRQSGRQVVYRADEVRSARSLGVRGQQSAEAALTALLAGSGFATRIDGKLVAIVRASGNVKTAAINGASSEESLGTDTAESEILVTGSRIRGGKTPSPVITISAERMQEEGFNDLGEVIRSIPQNFSGGQNPGVASGASQGGFANQNIGGGSGLNLRGLGPDATLTLLNGRRMPYGSIYQAVDISAIPMEAVNRIEIIPDGASAIYGSDAVAGVANIVLNREFDGLTIGARYGGATDGGMNTHELTATTGTGWSTGGLIVGSRYAKSDALYSTQRGYTKDMFTPSTLYPELKSYGALISAHQSVGEIAKFRVDAFYNHRDSLSYIAYSGFFYRSPISSETKLVSPSLQFSLPRSWSVTLSGSYGRDKVTNRSIYTTPSTSVLSSVCYCNSSYSYDLDAEGPIFSLPGGDARVALGAGSRTIEFWNRSYTSSTIYGGQERTNYAYLELSLPFVAPDMEIAGIHRLAFSAAIRGEDYNSFGSVITPKLGIIYQPNDDISLKASWGRSFKAPTMLQRFQTRYAYLYKESVFGATGSGSNATVLYLDGGNSELKPEKAETFSMTGTFHPQAVPGLEVELTYFHVDYTDRVVMPIASAVQALSNPIYAEFVDYAPTTAELDAWLAAYALRNSTGGAAYDPNNVIAVVRNQYTNAARQRVKGVDLTGSYTFDLAHSKMSVRGSASWLGSQQKTSSSQDFFDLSGNIYYPAKYRGRIGAVWSDGGYSASGFVNYTSSVRNKLASATEETGSFVTFDATLRYRTGESRGALAGIMLELTAQNLFNAKPPLNTVTTATYAPYDSTNYSSIGRFLSFSISKHF